MQESLPQLLKSVFTKTLPRVAQTRPLRPLRRFSVREDLARCTGEVPAIPDPVVPNSCFGTLQPTSEGRQFVVISSTYEKTDNAIVSAVIDLPRHKCSTGSNGRIQQRRRTEQHRHRRRVLFVCCCNKTDFLRNRTRDHVIGPWLHQGLTAFLPKSCSFPNYFGKGVRVSKRTY